MLSLGGDIFVLSCIVNYQRDSCSEFTSDYFPFFLLSVNDIRFMTKNIESSSYALEKQTRKFMTMTCGQSFVLTHPISVRTTLVCHNNNCWFLVSRHSKQIKIKIKTVRQIKSRIGEMKGGKYKKTLPKIWVEGIIRVRDIRGNVSPKFKELCMETPCWSSSG